MSTTDTLLDAVNVALESAQESPHRWHLGASLIGDECARKLWYTFFWAYTHKHEGRILRLFDRGNREEERFVGWLRAAGLDVSAIDPETGEQFRVSDCRGHFGGSLDAELKGLPNIPPRTVALGEFKTHNDKSFQKLKKERVFGAKHTHWVQMQIYMLKRKRKIALYCAINKNDDELYFELVERDDKQAREYIARADTIIKSTEAPIRLSNNASFFLCKQCDFSPICHGLKTPAVNCRTCAHSTPIDDGRWSCSRHNITFSKPKKDDKGEAPDSPMLKGCTEHVFNPNFLNRVEYLGGHDERHTRLKLNDGSTIIQGPDHVKSIELVLK